MVATARCSKRWSGAASSSFLAFLVLCLSGALLIPWLGQDFFPATDNGQFLLHVRAKTGTRIEETARLCDLVENSIRRVVPANELDNILDNIGLPYSSINYLHGSSGVLGASEADVLVSLREKHHPTADYVATLRNVLPSEFPGTTFYFLPADMVTQILNFGLPAPIDVQIEGADVVRNRDRRGPGSGTISSCARLDRPARPAAFRLPEVPYHGGPHQGTAGRLQPARYRHRPADFA